MRRVDRELGRDVWEEPNWRSEPYRNPTLSRLIAWHDLRRRYDLLEIFPKYTREYYLANGMPLDDFLKVVYDERRLWRMRQDSVFISLLPKQRLFA